MTTSTPETAIAKVNSTVASAEKWTPARMVRELASSPANLYNWLSGPPMTDLQRSRSVLADVSNEQGSRSLII